MSTSVSSSAEHQKNKGHGTNIKPSNGKFPSGSSKDHHIGDRDEVDSWRNQNQSSHHQQVYSPPSMGTGPGSAPPPDPYMPAYYGAFQYSAPTPTTPPTNFTVDGHGPWSTNGAGPDSSHSTGFLGSYSQHDSGNYNNIDNGGGMFGGGYSNFGGGQPGFGYGGYPGNGEYNTWGPRRGYDDYYNDDRNMKLVDGMGALSMNERRQSLKDSKDFGGGPKKPTSWASIASQPAKPTSLLKKKTSMGGIPQPPLMLGAWDKNGGTVSSKPPISAPVQAPHPPAWERMDRVVPKTSPPPPQQMAQMNPIQQQQMPPPLSGDRHGGPPQQNRSYHPGNQMNYNHHSQQLQTQSQQPPHPQPLLSQPQQSHAHHHSTNNSSYSNTNSNNVAPTQPVQNATDKNSTSAAAPTATPAPAAPSGPAYPDEAKMKSDYNPAHFDLNAEGARFFVIKSYSEDDIHRSIKYEIWCSTEHGNKRLDQAWRERDGKGPIYLFFSVNSSGHFCGMAQMMSSVDYDASSSVWCQDKWKGQFKVKWVYVKDVPNGHLRHIRLQNNENKPVTNSRDTQEVPFEEGKQVLKILHTFHHTTSIFDDFVHYEKRQEEEDQRKIASPVAATNSKPLMGQDRGGDRDNRGPGGPGRGGGGYHSRGGAHNDQSLYHQSRDRDFHNSNPRDNNNYNSRDRDSRDNRPHQRDGGYHHQGQGSSDRGFHGRGGGGMRSSDRDRDRGDHYGMRGGGGRGFDKPTMMDDRGDRDFYRDRGDRPNYNDNRGGPRGGGPGRPPRN